MRISAGLGVGFLVVPPHAVRVSVARIYEKNTRKNIVEGVTVCHNKVRMLWMGWIDAMNGMNFMLWMLWML